jgi:2-polyprenyl-3-methyl-5-hydroxy-6-metoxy-1,4-benzoquinol methylase
MKYDEKRLLTDHEQVVQQRNQSWWTSQTMSYDWNESTSEEKYTPGWYDEVDRRFLHSARLFSAEAGNPFLGMMDAANLKGKRILEIGCGMGFHTELLIRAGAIVTSIDLSPTSVASTQRRLELKGLGGDVQQMDAEAMSFADQTFDMVWSWGVIHHSSRTGHVIREIERILKPGGSARIMVYNLEGMPSYVAMATSYLWRFWVGASLDEELWKATDGFTARHYTRDLLADQLRTFFTRVDLTIFGQDADAVPLPRRLRKYVLPLIGVTRQRQLARRWGAFLFAVAWKANATG